MRVVMTKARVRELGGFTCHCMQWTSWDPTLYGIFGLRDVKLLLVDTLVPYDNGSTSALSPFSKGRNAYGHVCQDIQGPHRHWYRCTTMVWSPSPHKGYICWTYRICLGGLQHFFEAFSLLLFQPMLVKSNPLIHISFIGLSCVYWRITNNLLYAHNKFMK